MVTLPKEETSVKGIMSVTEKVYWITASNAAHSK